MLKEELGSNSRMQTDKRCVGHLQHVSRYLQSCMLVCCKYHTTYVCVTFVALEVARLHHGIILLQFVTNLNNGAILCSVNMHPCSMLTQTAIAVLNSMLLAYAFAK